MPTNAKAYAAASASAPLALDTIPRRAATAHDVGLGGQIYL